MGVPPPPRKRGLFYDFKILLVVVILDQAFHITHQYLFLKFAEAWPEAEKSIKPRLNKLKFGSQWVYVKECFHSRGQHLCTFIGTKESVCIRKEFNSHRTGLGHQHGRRFIVLGHQHGRRFIVLGHQYGRRDVMWKHSNCMLSGREIATTVIQAPMSVWRSCKMAHMSLGNSVAGERQVDM